MFALLANDCFATCDLTRFRWECDLPALIRPAPSAYTLVYCGNTPVYINEAERATLIRYQRSNINMVLKLNGEYITAPCIVASQGGRQQ